MLHRENASSSCAMPCKRCHTAAPGDKCYVGVVWAKSHGIFNSPGDYPSLTSESSLEDFQEVLHERNLERCSTPCRDTVLSPVPTPLPTPVLTPEETPTPAPAPATTSVSAPEATLASTSSPAQPTPPPPTPAL